ncbi:CRISPR-associated endonuclease Cas2 [Roseospira goensis]|uniref:CRISPR-associated endoribonuclease Cas2 n=1 Tax=Roseospira goensis TaxID=391922 RepID=A0A7W6RXC0_9PROT|nr:CRISPR-associated endonuclease Cas2 [Roseospira goensis]MBB4284319.1 CRISPR-associated protein Cas2 [Roseospira goensis]
MTHLSGYRMTWMMILFDLPVGTKAERKRATTFRTYLLDAGFEMVQFSVYARFCATRELAEAQTREIERNLPKAGKVSILYFTDKQYETCRTYTGVSRQPQAGKPAQLVLF